MTETYAYDGDGTRFSRQIGSATPIRYVTDVNRGLPVTIDDGTRKYVYGVGLAYAVNGSSLEVYHADRLGSIRALTDAAGSVTTAYRTDEWGTVTAQTGSSTQPFGFTGEPRDATTLTYLRARYYDPSLGRMMSRDAVAGGPARPQSLNRYSYARNNPLTLADNSGLSAQQSRILRSAGMCYSGSIGAGLLNVLGGYGTASLCPVVDLSGSRALLFSVGGGEILGATIGVAGGPIASNGLINDLKAWFSVQGLSALIGPVTVGGEAIHSEDFSIIALAIQAGLGATLGPEFHNGATYTWIIDDPRILSIAALTLPIAEGWAIGELLLATGGVVEQ